MRTRGQNSKETANLLDCRYENRKCAANYEFDEAKEGGTVDVDQEVDDCFHNGQRKDEGIPGTVESPIDGIGELMVYCESHVLGKAGSGGSGTLCGFAARKKGILCALDGRLSRIGIGLKSEDDEEKRNDWIGHPS